MPTNELSCFGAELLTASLQPTEADLSEQQYHLCGPLTDGELSEQSCAELRDEVFICDRRRPQRGESKTNGDANQRIDFIWRRALRVSQTDGELSEQSCAELHLYRKLNRDAKQRIGLFWRRALRGYRGGLYEQPPWRSSAELRAERATSMEELC
ncbi:hypothetical protein Bbelb_377130 [Branchiostoma belcheri]|nr:hypothetical protein Bbelb_377130 [Branchiostoma belcheri]